MPQSSSGQRKMMRSMSPGGGSPFHDAPLPPHGDGNQLRPTDSTKRVRRAAKKQIRTREDRAARREEL